MRAEYMGMLTPCRLARAKATLALYRKERGTMALAVARERGRMETRPKSPPS